MTRTGERAGQWYTSRWVTRNFRLHLIVSLSSPVLRLYIKCRAVRPQASPICFVLLPGSLQPSHTLEFVSPTSVCILSSFCRLSILTPYQTSPDPPMPPIRGKKDNGALGYHPWAAALYDNMNAYFDVHKRRPQGSKEKV